MVTFDANVLDAETASAAQLADINKTPSKFSPPV
jgi:hypothetical protein